MGDLDRAPSTVVLTDEEVRQQMEAAGKTDDEIEAEMASQAAVQQRLQQAYDQKPPSKPYRKVT